MNKLYNNFSITGKGEHEANCQDFVEAILKKLNLSMPQKGAFGNYIKKMREKGLCSMEYSPDKSLRDAINLQESYQFKTHEELDIFVHDLIKKCSSQAIIFRHDYTGDEMLLKAFDRAFWLRHFRNQNDIACKPLMKKDTPEENDCPFKNPYETMTFMGIKP